MPCTRPGSVWAMSESFSNPIFGERGEPATDAGAEGTGNADVDAVIGSLEVLDDLPVAEHVAVFEQAHESLRRTLTNRGQAIDEDSPAAGRS
jgi:hypothetical protein